MSRLQSLPATPARGRRPRRKTGAAFPGDEIVYPENDGKPMAVNTRQFRSMVTIHAGLTALFADRPDVFIADDPLWYPVQGDNQLRSAPAVMVAFGWPPDDRGSYLQWREDGVTPQVVFEILSPGNTAAELNGPGQIDLQPNCVRSASSLTRRCE